MTSPMFLGKVRSLLEWVYLKDWLHDLLVNIRLGCKGLLGTDKKPGLIIVGKARCLPQREVFENFSFKLLGNIRQCF